VSGPATELCAGVWTATEIQQLMTKSRLRSFLEVLFAKQPQVVDLEGIERQSKVSVDNFVENLSPPPGKP